MVYQTLGGIREWRAVDQAAEDRRRRVRSQPTRWPESRALVAARITIAMLRGTSPEGFGIAARLIRL